MASHEQEPVPNQADRQEQIAVNVATIEKFLKLLEQTLAQNREAGFKEGAKAAISSITEEDRQLWAQVFGWTELSLTNPSVKAMAVIKVLYEISHVATEMLNRYNRAAETGDLKPSTYGGRTVLSIHPGSPESQANLISDQGQPEDLQPRLL